MLFIFSPLAVLILYVSLKASGKHCGMLTCWHVDILAAASGLEGAQAFQYVRTLTHRRVQKNQSVTVLKYFYWFRYHWNSRVPVPNSREFSSTCTNFFQYRYLNLFWYQILPVPFFGTNCYRYRFWYFFRYQMLPVMCHCYGFREVHWLFYWPKYWTTCHLKGTLGRLVLCTTTRASTAKVETDMESGQTVLLLLTEVPLSKQMI